MTKEDKDESLERSIQVYSVNYNYHHLIKLLTEDDWYGQLILNFEQGKIVHGKEIKSIKLF